MTLLHYIWIGSLLIGIPLIGYLLYKDYKNRKEWAKFVRSLGP
jgi:hypothetical protein